MLIQASSRRSRRNSFRSHWAASCTTWATRTTMKTRRASLTLQSTLLKTRPCTTSSERTTPKPSRNLFLLRAKPIRSTTLTMLTEPSMFSIKRILVDCSSLHSISQERLSRKLKRTDHQQLRNERSASSNHEKIHGFTQRDTVDMDGDLNSSRQKSLFLPPPQNCSFPVESYNTHLQAQKKLLHLSIFTTQFAI